jgi:ribosomal protein S18 acetylase RimI-like enzyme
MKMTHRAYAGEAGDFVRLCRLAVAGRREDWQLTTWCLGRIVDWKYGLWGAKLEAPNFCDANAHLWFDAFGGLAGLAISENGDANIAVITRAGYRFLFPEILDWALDAWAARGPRFSLELTERQELEARALEERGFRRGARYATRRFDLARRRTLAPPLEPGFAIVDMETAPDYRGRRLLRANAFQGREELSADELRADLQLDAVSRGGPIYHAACDIAVRAPDGRLVAGCEALLDAHNAEADIERVCTHSAFRRRGFARAAILACMERLRAMGMRHAYITGYSDAAIGLYGSLDHVAELSCWIYERDASSQEGMD